MRLKNIKTNFSNWCAKKYERKYRSTIWKTGERDILLVQITHGILAKVVPVRRGVKQLDDNMYDSYELDTALKPRDGWYTVARIEPGLVDRITYLTKLSLVFRIKLWIKNTWVSFLEYNYNAKRQREELTDTSETASQGEFKSFRDYCNKRWYNKGTK